jgi:hypothetical protein
MYGGHAYKTIMHTGGATGCIERPHPGTKSGNCTLHDPPLLFDLSVDEAESSPLDGGSSEAAAVRPMSAAG